MIFELTDEQKLVQETAREFAHNDIAPTLEEEEKNHEFRLDRVARMGELGFFSCAVPEELGGTGFGFMESVLMAEQVAKVSASWRLPFNMQNLGPALTVAKFGTEAQRHKFIPGWVAGTQNRLLRDDRTGERFGRRQHEDRCPRQGRPLGAAGQQDLGIERRAGRRRPALRHDQPGEEAPGDERVYPGTEAGREPRGHEHRHEAGAPLRPDL